VAGGAAEMMAGASAGPILTVKNTFLDFVDEPPGKNDLSRSHTTPAIIPRSCSEDSDDRDPDADNQANEPNDDLMPEMQDIYRCRTDDGYEPYSQWSWASTEELPAANVQNSQCLGQVPYMMVAMPVMVPTFPAPGMDFGKHSLPSPEIGAKAQQASIPSEPPQTFGATAAEAIGPGDASSSTASGVAGQEGVSVSNMPAQTTVDVPPLQPPPRPQVLQRDFSVASCVFRIHWAVDAKKLTSTDREAVSPAFELSFSGVPVQFKIVIRPKVTTEARGGASFKKAKGKGSVEVRCLGEVDPEVTPAVTFRIWIGSGGTEPVKREDARGPVKHNFADRTICGLPEGQEEWDFSRVVDDATKTFVVCLEILAGTAGA